VYCVKCGTQMVGESCEKCLFVHQSEFLNQINQTSIQEKGKNRITAGILGVAAPWGVSHLYLGHKTKGVFLLLAWIFSIAMSITGVSMFLVVIVVGGSGAGPGLIFAFGLLLIGVAGILAIPLSIINIIHAVKIFACSINVDARGRQLTGYSKKQQ